MPNHFYLLNPHRDDFIWEPLYFRVIKRRPLKKYNYLAEIFEQCNEVELLFSDFSSGIIPANILKLLPKALRRLLVSSEIKYWSKLNKIKRQVTIHWFDDHKVYAGDRMFTFQLSNLDFFSRFTNSIRTFKRIHVHLSHCYLGPQKISLTFQDLDNVEFCGDADISTNDFFKKYFSWYKGDFKLTPFFVSDRFSSNIEFEKRVSKIVTTGTFHLIENYKNSQYLSRELGINSFHRYRRHLYENREKLSDIFTCYISPWLQKEVPWYRRVVQAKLGSQKSYFSINLVDEYNRHKFALVGEEICGFPGIGTFEAMACGCIVLANPETLKGLVSENSFYIPIGNDTNLEEINQTLTKFSSLELQTMSKAAVDYVNSSLRSDRCIDRFTFVFQLAV